MANDDKLILVPVPALVAVLLNKEKAKGSPLTEAEVLAIRDGCECIAMPVDVYENVCQERGYSDIDPELAWEEWCKIRPSLS